MRTLMSLRLARLATALILALCPVLQSAAQESDVASVSITVMDQTGAVIPNAVIALDKLPSPYKRKMLTNANGEIDLHLGFGTYDIGVSSQGFKSATKRMEITSAISQDIQVVLQVGSCTQCVTVDSYLNTDYWNTFTGIIDFWNVLVRNLELRTSSSQSKRSALLELRERADLGVSPSSRQVIFGYGWYA
jgi:hypothetical protein